MPTRKIGECAVWPLTFQQQARAFQPLNWSLNDRYLPSKFLQRQCWWIGYLFMQLLSIEKLGNRWLLAHATWNSMGKEKEKGWAGNRNQDWCCRIGAAETIEVPGAYRKSMHLFDSFQLVHLLQNTWALWTCVKVSTTCLEADCHHARHWMILMQNLRAETATGDAGGGGSCGVTRVMVVLVIIMTSAAAEEQQRRERRRPPLSPPPSDRRRRRWGSSPPQQQSPPPLQRR